MADNQSSLSAAAVQEVPILWIPGKETIHVALVVPNMSWPLLFGENHLEGTQALSDHSAKTVTFRHPAMNFTVPCDKPSSHPPHVAVTCLLTGKPSTDPRPSQTTVHRGLNLLTAYLTLSAASTGLMGPNLWLTGHELEPGVKVLSGPLNATQIRPVMEFTSARDSQPDALPDFNQPLAMNVLVQCNKKKAKISNSTTFGNISASSDENKANFDAAFEFTAETLCASLDLSDPLLCQNISNLAGDIMFQPANDSSGKPATKTHLPSAATREMADVGLVQHFSTLSPFSQQGDPDDRDLPPQSDHLLDPFSEEYHQKLRHELRLDT